MRHTLRFAALAFGLSILFCATATNAQQQMRIRDDQGKPVVAAEVTITCDKNKRDGFADGGGTFAWAPLPPFPLCIVSISSARTEVFGTVLAIPPSGIVNAVYEVKRKQVWVVQVTVIDEEMKSPVTGVEVEFRCGGERLYQTTNSAGMAEIDKFTALFGKKECSITTDHNLYDPFTTTVAIPKEPTEPVSLRVPIKRKINVKTVQVTVVDSDTNKPIQDARVALIGRFFSAYRGTTGASGVADIQMDRLGTFQIEVAQDNYYPDKSTKIFVESGASAESLAATVSLSRKKTRDGAPIAVTVKGKRLDGTIVSLENAKVRIEGGDEVSTDYDGKTTARLPGVTADLVNIDATANGYEAETKQFAVPRFSVAMTAPELTFILNEKKRAITGVTLIIEVTNRADRKPIEGASVSIDGRGTAKTDSDGYARFTIANDSIKGETYLRAMVSKSDFKDKWSDIGIDLLKPSEEPSYYSIAIEPSKTGPDSIFVGTWNGTGNAAGITVTFNENYSMTFKDSRPGYQRSGEGKWHRDPDSVDGVRSPINYSLFYRDGKLIDPWGNIYNK